MKKIQSLFQRNHDGDHQIRNEILPGSEWVVNGEGVATRKWDGTACLVRDGKLYKRFDAKGGKPHPEGFIPSQEPDPITGHHPGWVLVGNNPEDKWHREAWDSSNTQVWADLGLVPDATYELIGPKVGGNPEGVIGTHVFRKHGADVIADFPRAWDSIREYFRTSDIEGVVWWRDLSDQNCDKVKIKAKDFGIKRNKPSTRSRLLIVPSGLSLSLS